MNINDNILHKKNSSYSPTYSKKRFTPSEDRIIISLAKPNCSNDWTIIAKSVEKRSARQCRDRWNNYLNPNLNKDEWSPEEDELLLKAFKEKGPQWKSFSLIFKGRSINNVRNRCFKLLRKCRNHLSVNANFDLFPNDIKSHKKGNSFKDSKFVSNLFLVNNDISKLTDPPDSMSAPKPTDNLNMNQINVNNYYVHLCNNIENTYQNTLQNKDNSSQPAQCPDQPASQTNAHNDDFIDTSMVDKLMGKLEAEFTSADLFTSPYDMEMDSKIIQPRKWCLDFF